MTGVLIDDLIIAGASEPYRMFTSRSELRLVLRAENADVRLTERGIAQGLICEEREAVLRKKLELIDEGMKFLTSYSLPNNKWH